MLDPELTIKQANMIARQARKLIGTHPASNRLFQVLDLYWRSLESGGLRYTSR